MRLIENRALECCGVRQVGFASLLSGKRKGRLFCVRARLYKEEKDGGELAGRSGGNAQNKEEGILLGTERDGSGSIVGFNLIPGKKKIRLDFAFDGSLIDVGCLNFAWLCLILIYV